MFKKLHKKKLVIYTPYKGIILTDLGKKNALNIIRNQRLWNTYLVTQLDFMWNDIQNISNELEHINSAILINKIDKLMNFPKYDPFGDPIPSEKGTIFPHSFIVLQQAKPNDKCRLAGIKDKSASFISTLNSYNITPFL